MGWNDAKVSLLAPGWALEPEVSSRERRTSDGSPVQVFRCRQMGSAVIQSIKPQALEEYLVGKGFTISTRHQEGNALKWEDVEAQFEANGNELTQLLLTFTLTQNSPTRWETWRELMESICDRWDFHPYDTKQQRLVDRGEALRVLSETQSWREFQSRWGWPAVPRSNAAPIVS